MKTIRLMKMKLENFKGVSHYVLELNGENGSVRGINETGKTTLADANSWLWLDKDTFDQAPEKGFEIKPRNPDKTIKNGLETVVEETIEIDGNEYLIKKTFKEKWVPTKGEKQKNFTGNTTTYFINETPLSKSKFYEKINEIAGDIETIKTLNNPVFFNEILPWKDRRELLITLSGDVEREDIFEHNPKLEGLRSELLEKSIEDMEATLKYSRKKLVALEQEIPTRIDEAEKNKPDTATLSKNDIERDILSLDFEIDNLEKLKIKIENGSEITELKKRKAEIETRIIDATNIIKTKVSKNDEKERTVLRVKKSELYELENALKFLKNKNENFEEDLKKLSNERDSLRAEYVKINGNIFESAKSIRCPLGIPCDHAAQATTEMLEKLKKEFNYKKVENLKSIRDSGLIKKETIESCINFSEKNKRAIDSKESEISLKQKEITNLEKAIKEKEFTPDFNTPELEKLRSDIYLIEKSIEGITQNSEFETDKIKDKIKDKKKEKEVLQESILLFKTLKNIDERIVELNKEFKNVSSKIEEIDEKLFLIETFSRTRAKLLEEKINSKFKICKFTLFEDQINGGVSEACHCTYKGIRYESMNKGAKMNCSLDIINTLSDYYNLRVPVFVDNCESNTNLMGMKNQVIKLYVDESCKVLTIIN